MTPVYQYEIYATGLRPVRLLDCLLVLSACGVLNALADILTANPGKPIRVHVYHYDTSGIQLR